MKTALFAILLITVSACSTVNAPCEELSRHNKNALNIIVFQDGFSEQEFRELGTYVKDTLLEKEPFRNRPYMNFYLIQQDNPEICVEGEQLPIIDGYSPDPLAPLRCDIEKVKVLASSCGVEKAKLIILTNDTVASQTSMTFAESGVMFLDMKNQPPEIIQHEFAHFFGLVDERAKLYSHSLGPGREAGAELRHEPGTSRNRVAKLLP
jgi:hypothetical protein